MSALTDLSHDLPADRLLPGDPVRMAELGETLSGYVDLLADAARALGRIEVEWDGDAATWFRDEFGLQPGRFARLAAERAGELFASGTRAAAAAEGGLFGDDAGPLDLVTSPAGREQRLAAVELLERARSDVDRAGNVTAETLRSAMTGTPETVSTGQHVWNFLLAPPWELNEERLDWAAGAAVGMLDTAVMASNPLPIAPWVTGTLKPQVNAEWRLGADPRSGLHTAGSVVVPGVLTGPVAAGPTRFGIALSELESKPPESINLYRGMRAASDGLPELGETAKTLGVRPGGDIPLRDGVVVPKTGGMSVNTTIEGLAGFRKPPAFGGTAKDLTLFQIRMDDVRSSLVLVPDKDGHCTVQPAESMTYALYLRLLQDTRPDGRLWRPNEIAAQPPRRHDRGRRERPGSRRALRRRQAVRGRRDPPSNPHGGPRPDPRARFRAGRGLGPRRHGFRGRQLRPHRAHRAYSWGDPRNTLRERWS